MCWWPGGINNFLCLCWSYRYWFWKMMSRSEKCFLLFVYSVNFSGRFSKNYWINIFLALYCWRNITPYFRHKYGLAGAVMTRDLGKAIYVSNALRAGTVCTVVFTESSFSLVKRIRLGSGLRLVDKDAGRLKWPPTKGKIKNFKIYLFFLVELEEETHCIFIWKQFVIFTCKFFNCEISKLGYGSGSWFSN